MKDFHRLPTDRQQLIKKLSPMSNDADSHTDETRAEGASPCQSQVAPDEVLLEVSAAALIHLPHITEQSRMIRERNDRATLEDKIRRAIDSWSAEERATAYWYLYACGMTLDRAKTIRHKGGFHA